MRQMNSRDLIQWSSREISWLFGD